MKPLNPRQLRFVQCYVRLGNATKAALEAGYKGNTDVQAQRLLGNASIHAMIEAAKQDMQTLFAAEAYDSLQTIKALRDDADQPGTVRLQAAKDLLDRGGHKPTEKVEHGGGVSIDHGIAPDEFNAVLAALGYDPLGGVASAGTDEVGGGNSTPTADPDGEPGPD